MRSESWCPSRVVPALFILFLFEVGESLLEPAIRLYVTDGVCREMSASRNRSSSAAVECSRLGDSPDVEDDVQSTSAVYLMYYKLVVNVPGVLVSLFCGAWSDRIGRRPPIILTCLGTIAGVVFYVVSGRGWSQPWQTGSLKSFLCLVFVGTAVRGVFGRSAVIAMAIHRSRSYHSSHIS